MSPVTNYVYSVIRTAVPYLVGFLLSIPGAPWLARALGVDAATSQRVLSAATAFVLALAYYMVVRVLEQKWPALGALLGVPQRPVYGDLSITPAAAADPSPTSVQPRVVGGGSALNPNGVVITVPTGAPTTTVTVASGVPGAPTDRSADLVPAALGINGASLRAHESARN